MNEHDNGIRYVTRAIRALNAASVPTLLPAYMQDQRAKVPVVDSIGMKRHPDGTKETNLQIYNPNSDEYQRFEQSTAQHTLLSVESLTHSKVKILDKTYPHALLEVMLMQSSEEIKPSLFDLDEETQRLCFGIMRNFAQYALDNDLYPYIGYSYDPDTNDRQTGQGVKRFHAHLIGRTKEELAFIRSNQRALEDLSNLQGRRIVDETSIIGSHILQDKLQGERMESVEIIPPFSKELPLMPNTMFRLRHGWQTLVEEDFRLDFSTVHNAVLEGYDEIMGCIWEGESGIWERPTVRSPDQIFASLSNVSYLSGVSRELIMYAMRQMQPGLMEKTDIYALKGDYRKLSSHVYPMAGPCYSTSFCEVEGQIYGTIRPYIFSDLGGAGIGNPLGIITKTAKGLGEMSDEELQERAQFQKRFLQYVTEQL